VGVLHGYAFIVPIYIKELPYGYKNDAKEEIFCAILWRAVTKASKATMSGEGVACAADKFAHGPASKAVLPSFSI
jgi:hypothetical protein